MANAALIAKAAATVLTDENTRKTVGWIIVAVLSPIILVIAFLCALASGSATHNVSAAELCFYGGELPEDTPEEYRTYIEDMRASFGRLAVYIVGARDIVNAELDRAAEHIIREAAEHISDGAWRLPFDTLEERFGLNVRVGNGFDKMVFDKLSAREEVGGIRMGPDHIGISCRLNFCTDLDEPPAKSLADLPEKRRADLLKKAVGVALESYDGEDLYTMLHDSFGLSIQEIRDLNYLSDEDMADICHVPQAVLNGKMRVRDILQLDGLSERTSFLHKESKFRTRLNDLKELTASGQEDFAALLDARIADVTVCFDVPQLRLEGVAPAELTRLEEMLVLLKS